MGEKRFLFLDDRSKRLHAALRQYGEYDLTLVCTVKECIKMISNEPKWNMISLDHDLDFEEFVPSLLPNTGMEVVRWLEEHHDFLVEDDKVPDWIVIHTSNLAAAHNMATRLKNAGYSVIEERFTYGD